MRLRQMLRSALSQRDIFCDAGFDKETGKSVLCHCSQDMSIVNSEPSICKDSNEAELDSVLIALDKYPLAKIFTDSQYVVDKLKSPRIEHIPREHNIANMLVRAYKEQAIARNPHQSPKKES